MAVVMPPGRQAYFNTDDTPLVGGRLRTFAAGTSTPKATYSDAAATVANANPVVLDARGEATVYWQGAYRVQLETAAGAVIWTVDNFVADDAAVTDAVTEVPAASTVDLTVTSTRTVVITGGGATITSFGPVAGTAGLWRILRFTGTNTIQGGASLALPGDYTNSMTTRSLDYAIVISYANQWRFVAYTRNNEPFVDENGNVFINGPRLTLDANSVFDATFGALSVQPTYRNRLHNADLVIDQVNAPGTIATNPTAGRLIDRWRVSQQTSTGSVTWARNLSKTAVLFGRRGAGQLTISCGTAASPSAGHLNALIQRLEGIDVVDLAWGTSRALPVTVSLTLQITVGGSGAGVGDVIPIAIRNGAGNRSYVTSITLTSIFLTRYSVTIPGDTAGTWATDNSTGFELVLDVGSGSNFVTATPGTWTATAATTVSGARSLINSLGVLTIMAVQVEAGSVDTPFEQRPASIELPLCQRYYQRLAAVQFAGYAAAAGNVTVPSLALPVTMRATPNCTVSSTTFVNATAVTVTGASGASAQAVIAASGAGGCSAVATVTAEAEL
jgi:hypothetical protein